MSDVATAVKEEKEADHHPYFRPKDAATLILIDRSGEKPKVLVGKRHDKVVFMPGKYVFPGGRVDKSDNRIPVAAPISAELEANLLKGSPKIVPSRARALAVAAIREACEETGLCLGRKVEKPVKLEGAWQAVHGSGPAARSVQPVSDCARHHPTRPRPPFRYALLHRGCLQHRPPRRRRDPCGRRTRRTGMGRDRLAAARRRACHDQERARRTRPPPRHRPLAPRRAVPFFHFYGGKMQKDVLGA